jgi:hypothetical protein
VNLPLRQARDLLRYRSKRIIVSILERLKHRRRLRAASAVVLYIKLHDILGFCHEIPSFLSTESRAPGRLSGKVSGG